MNSFDANARMTISGIEYGTPDAPAIGSLGGRDIHRIETASFPLHRTPRRAVKWTESGVAHGGLFWDPPARKHLTRALR